MESYHDVIVACNERPATIRLSHASIEYSAGTISIS